MTSTTQTKDSDHFVILHQPIAHNTNTGPEEFRQALDLMGIENIIECLSNDNRTLTSPDMGALVRQADEATSFQAYAYLSPPGYLQIWMEAINRQPEPAMLATARFSWKLQQDGTPENHVLHDQYARRMYQLMRSKHQSRA